LNPDPNTGWNEYTNPFSISEESCHVIQFYSVDNLGNVEPIYHQCVFVDNKPPDVWKDIGDPKVDTGMMSDNFMESIQMPISSEYDVADEAYFVTQNTQISLTCNDLDPHPVGGEKIYYKYYNDGNLVQDWTLYDGPFTYNEDTYHQLYYYCEDALGNKGDTHFELDIVDTTPPNITTSVIDHHYYDEVKDKLYIDGVTKIYVEAVDPNPHPVDDVKCDWWYYVDDDTTPIQGGSDLTPPFNISFPEESKHNLWIKCWDALGNDNETHEVYYVDHTPPTTLKVYGQPRYPVEIKTDELCQKDDVGPDGIPNTGDETWQCIPEGPTGTLTYKASGPVLEITVKLSGLKPETEYQLTLNGRNGGDGNDELANNCPNPNGPKEGYEYAWECGYWSSGTEQEGFWNFDMKATTDSNGNYEKTYYLEMPEGHYGIPEDNNPPYGVGFIVKEAADAPGGSNYPPILMEYHGLDWTIEPYEYPLWITSQTPIMLMSSDGDSIHASGVNKTWYRDIYFGEENQSDWEYCFNQSACDEWVNDDRATVWALPTAPEPYNPSSRGFVLWDETPFYLAPESCHIIEYYSFDNVGKVEQVKHQCVFVDNSAPEPDKKVGEPKTKWDGSDAYYYDISDFCGSNPGACWKVTTMTPISLDCTDHNQPHPVPEKRACFKVGWDADDVTVNYCGKMNGEMKEDGYCCLDHTGDFYFNEETEHELQYYCVDALGNKGDTIDHEYFKVTGTTFNITLNKKWNLISVPFVMLDDSIDEVFKDIKDDVLAVWTYDASTDQWYVYTPDGDDSNDNLHTMKPGWGYWVITKDPTVLKIGGSLFLPGKTPPGKRVIHGWNLIGYYGTDELPGYYGPQGNGGFTYCELYSLVDTNMGHPRWSSVVTYWEPDNPNSLKFLGLDDRMDPGAGYWIEMDVEDDYSPSKESCGLVDILPYL